MNFSQRLKQLRIESGNTQEELSKKLDITRSALANYEQGKRKPDYEMLEVIADYFNVDMDYLICRTDKNKGEMEIRAMRYYEKLCNLSEENQKLVEAMIDKLSEIKD